LLRQPTRTQPESFWGKKVLIGRHHEAAVS